VSQGKILVAVENPADGEISTLERTLKGSGITEVRRVT